MGDEQDAVADEPAAAEPHDADPDDGAAPVERRDFGHVVFVIGPDAATVGRAVREESSGAAGRVLAFVGAPDHPAIAEMLAELGAEATETPGS